MDKKAKIKRIALISLCTVLVVAISFAAGYFTRSAVMSKELSTIDYILNMYHKYYYEDLDTDEVIELIDNALLDQYSEYYTPEEYELIHKASQGSHEGIGASFSGFDVVEVYWNSPADRAGIVPGGKLVAYKQSLTGEFIPVTENTSLSDAIGSIEPYTDFVLKIDYNGVVKEHTLQREEYTETFVRYYDSEKAYGFREIDGEMQFVEIGANTAYDLKGKTNVAVIDYNGFAALRDGIYGSSGQFSAAMSRFKADNKENLILDLRDNGGGYMDILTEVAAHLVGAENGKKVPISIVRDKNGKEEIYNSAKVQYHNYNFKSITVLCNDWTASASEALIGAMLDYDDSDIVKVIIEAHTYGGQKYYSSYGKGIMQTTFENAVTGGAIKLTTARLFWPKSNVTIHGTGVTTELNNTLYGGNKTKIFNESENGCVYDAVG